MTNDLTVVFVDYMNALISCQQIFIGSNLAEEVLFRSRSIGLEFGETVRVLVYVNTLKLTQRAFAELQYAAARTEAEIVHVDSYCGLDMVDEAMFDDLWSEHRLYRQSVPFVLITADKDFKPTIRELVQEGRRVYVGIPPYIHFPSTALVASGHRWLEELNRLESLAMYFVFTHDFLPGESELLMTEQFEDIPEFSVMSELGSALLDVLPVQAFLSAGETAFGLYLAELAGFDIPPIAAEYVVRAMIHYGVLIPDDGGYYATNFPHPAFARARLRRAQAG
jgi:hypothetical protein